MIILKPWKVQITNHTTDEIYVVDDFAEFAKACYKACLDYVNDKNNDGLLWIGGNETANHHIDHLPKEEQARWLLGLSMSDDCDFGDILSINIKPECIEVSA